MSAKLDIILHRAQVENSALGHDWGKVLSAGFGLEIDIRDNNGEIVICHDVPEKGNHYEPLENLLKKYKATNSSVCLSLNIKSCGLSMILKSLLSEYSITNYFCFDMAVPDCLNYEREGLVWYSRVSEYEPYDAKPCEMSSGIWLDIFDGTWFSCEDVATMLQAGKKVCLVASELHKRDIKETLDFVRKLNEHCSLENMAVCTDFPEKYKDLFNR